MAVFPFSSVQERARRQRAAITALAVLLGAALAGEAAANPGRAAPHCVQLTRTTMSHGESYRATNTCGVPIFVIYCGDLSGMEGACDGRRNTVFYTHSFNLRPGASHNFGTRRNGRLHWGACEGQIGFGNEGHFRDDRNGHYWCLAR